MKLRLVSAVAAALLLASGCGGDSPRPEDSDPFAQVGTPGVSPGGKQPGKVGGTATRPGRTKGPGDKADGGGAGEGGAGGGGTGSSQGGGSSGGGGNAALATGSSVVKEPTPDAQKSGVPPDYAEALEASLTGLGEDFRLQMIMNGNLPDRMATEGTFMQITFGLRWGKGDDEKQEAFVAQCTNRGWKAYAGTDKSNPQEFPGEFSVEGNTMTMTVPWSHINGPKVIRWSGSAVWFQSVAGVQNYSFDPIPNEGTKRYPED